MRRLIVALGWVAVATAACTDGGGDDDDGASVEVSGTVSDDAGVGLLATVLEAGASNSVETAPDGTYTIAVDGNGEVFILAVAVDYYPVQRGVITTGAAIANVDLDLPESALLSSAAGTLGITLDQAKGMLGVEFNGATIGTGGGFGAALSVASDGSFTFDSAGNPVLSSTTRVGNDQTLFFYGIDVGVAFVSPTSPGLLECAPDVAITDQRVGAGILTHVRFDCQ